MNCVARSRISVLALTLIAIGSAPAAFAQTTAPPGQADQDHRAHHPDANASEKPSVPPASGLPSMQPGGMGMKGMMTHGGMMSGDEMKQMMSMMRDMMTMMSAQSGMMASHAEARIAALKAELKITDAQAPQWNRFAEALRGTAKSMEDMHRQMMQSAATATLPARLARQEQMLSAHLVSLKTLKETLETLYASFSDDQKKIADGITIGPMGMM